MSYPVFYEHDEPNDIGDIENIADHFGIKVTDVDIWNQARESECPPHLANEYLSILYQRLEAKLNEFYPKLIIDYEANALASYFNVNNQRLSSLDQLIELIKADEN